MGISKGFDCSLLTLFSNVIKKVLMGQQISFHHLLISKSERKRKREGEGEEKEKEKEQEEKRKRKRERKREEIKEKCYNKSKRKNYHCAFSETSQRLIVK